MAKNQNRVSYVTISLKTHKITTVNYLQEESIYNADKESTSQLVIRISKRQYERLENSF